MLKKMIRLNVMALTSLSLRMARRMKREGRGRIMNVASGRLPACPYLGVYGATRGYTCSPSPSRSQRSSRARASPSPPSVPAPRARSSVVTAGLSQESPFDRLSADPERVAETGFKGMIQAGPRRSCSTAATASAPS